MNSNNNNYYGLRRNCRTFTIVYFTNAVGKFKDETPWKFNVPGLDFRFEFVQNEKSSLSKTSKQTKKEEKLYISLSAAYRGNFLPAPERP